MKCRVCGRETEEGSGYCSHCGSPLPAKRRFVPGSKREWALVVVAVAIMVSAAVGLAIATWEDEPGDPPTGVWLSDDVVAYGAFADGRFSAELQDHYLAVIYGDMIADARSYTWSLTDASGHSQSWWEMLSVTRLDLRGLGTGTYTLTLTIDTQEVSGTFEILRALGNA